MTTVKNPSDSVTSDSLRPHGLYSPWNSPGQNTGVSSLSPHQGIFPTQGSNPGLPHCRRILYQLSHKGSPRILEWVAYPFSSESSRPRNLTSVSCIAGGIPPPNAKILRIQNIEKQRVKEPNTPPSPWKFPNSWVRLNGGKGRCFEVDIGLEVLAKIEIDFYYFKSGLNDQNETVLIAEYGWKFWHLHESQVSKKREWGILNK